MKTTDMITITLRLSESLLSIFRDSGQPKPEVCRIRVPSGASVEQIMIDQGINPLLVPMASLCTGNGSQRVDKNDIINSDGTLILYGPLAGG